MSKKFEISRTLGIPDSVELPECLEPLRFLPQAEFIAKAFELELSAKRTYEAVRDCLTEVMKGIGISSQFQGIIELDSADILTCSFVDQSKIDRTLLKKSPYYSRVMEFVMSDADIEDRIPISRRDLELYIRTHPHSSLEIPAVSYSAGYYKIIKTKNKDEL